MSRFAFAACAFAAPLLFACSATSNPARPSQPARVTEKLQVAPVERKPVPVAEEQPAAPEAAGLTVARIAGSSVDVREMLDQWLFTDSPAVHDALGELVVSRFTLAEASRLGMRIPDEQLELAYQRGLAALTAEVERVSPGVPVDQFLKDRRGVEPAWYRERLREQSARAMIAERAVRAWLLTTDHVIARAIVCQDRAQLEEVEAALEGGAEFALLAKELDQNPRGAGDGVLPPITRNESPLSRLAFVTPVGELGGPIEQGGSFLLLQVDARPEPIEGDWRAIGAQVERSLEERPVQELEFVDWEEAMFTRYEVDTTPFLELIGAPMR